MEELDGIDVTEIDGILESVIGKMFECTFVLRNGTVTATNLVIDDRSA
jgi:hypothetical protein